MHTPEQELRRHFRLVFVFIHVHIPSLIARITVIGIISKVCWGIETRCFAKFSFALERVWESVLVCFFFPQGSTTTTTRHLRAREGP